MSISLRYRCLDMEITSFSRLRHTVPPLHAMLPADAAPH
jgi:hypothetical protein